MKRIICAILAASVLASCGAAEADMPGGIMTAGAGFSTDFPGSYRVDVPPEMTADRPETAAAASSSQKPSQTDTAPVGRDGIIEKIPADDGHGEGLWLDVAVSPEHTGADYRIFNRTDGDITFGPDEDYRLMVRDGGGWLDIGFPERPMAGILLTLPAGEVYTAHVDWTDLCGELDDGTYRLIKPVNDGSSPVEIAGDFVVGISVDIVGFHSVDTVGFPKCGLDYTVTNGSGYTLTLYPDEWHIEKFDGENWARIEASRSRAARAMRLSSHRGRAMTAPSTGPTGTGISAPESSGFICAFPRSCRIAILTTPRTPTSISPANGRA